MNYNRRLPWLFLVVCVVITFATTLQKDEAVAQTQKSTETIRVTPIVFLEEHIANRNRDVYKFIEDLNRSKEEQILEEELRLKNEIKIKKELALKKKDIEEIEPVKDYQDVTLTISFYTALESENGKGRANMNAIGGKLVANQSIAVPRDIPFGSILEIEGYGKRVCDDRGSKKYIKWLNDEKTHMKVDLYIARNKGESDSQYWKRVNALGIVRDVKAKLYIKGD